uniref:Uncharacterized protein n=1 Tax=Anguilla anguilla TaxID=7936 RepID=A0A0E9SPZ5_ANGAN
MYPTQCPPLPDLFPCDFSHRQLQPP